MRRRDIACRNLLVDERTDRIDRVADRTTPRTVKLGDFGLSRVSEDSLSSSLMVASGSSRGPVAWMAPEQIQSRSYSDKSDVFMFGVCMFEMVR